ncbi:ferritin-like domain-containing protein [Mycobacterium sp. AMU20-3851]|uniref:ferritin-like domain-containing protein n=1 Tax=Mycobacterium sp. AMU20-3851 TaxID=3122055 RepID=UPI00375437CE
MTDTTTLITNLRTVLELTSTEIQIAEVRTGQARTEAVREELAQNAENARTRAALIEATIRDLGGSPDIIGPFLGRAAATVKALTEQAEPFAEALLGDLALEHQLVDRARYLKSLAVAGGYREVADLADSLIEAHSATVLWLTTILAEEALGGPAALRRTPIQAAAGAAVKIANLPGILATRAVDRLLTTVRATRPAVDDALARGGHAGEIAAKTLSASRDAALSAAEKVSRREGADDVADALHTLRGNAGVLESDELPITGYDDLNVNDAVAAVKELTEPADIRVIIAYEEFHKNRQRVVSAAQSRLSAIAQEIVGIS